MGLELGATTAATERARKRSTKKMTSGVGRKVGLLAFFPVPRVPPLTGVLLDSVEPSALSGQVAAAEETSGFLRTSRSPPMNKDSSNKLRRTKKTAIIVAMERMHFEAWRR
jgi:hypothetical protein